MKRKEFLKKGLASGAFIGTSAFASGQDPKNSTQKKVDKDKIIQRPMGDPEEIVIERPMPGKPHTGKSSSGYTGTFR